MEDAVTLARHFAERALGAGDMMVFDAIVADNVVVETGLKPEGPIRGKAEYAQVIAATLGRALSNAEMQIDEVLPAGPDRAIVRFTARADNSGELWGVQPTGRRLTLREIHLMRFRDGKLVENFVGGMNPLEWETIYAAPTAAKLFGDAA